MSMRNQYHPEIDNQVSQIDEKLLLQEKWNITCDILHLTAEHVLGKKEKRKKINGEELKSLSEQSQNIRHKAEQCRDQEKTKQLRKERKEINNKINKLIKHSKNRRLKKCL